jgi:uncharacterized protein YyaL (SSP411 family)
MAVADMKSSLKVRSVLLVIAIFIGQTSHILRAQPRKVWESHVLATSAYMQQKMWNPNNGNFIRRTDAPPTAQKSDAWGITIVLDAYSYMVRAQMLKPEDLRHYFESSTTLYNRTEGGTGARIIAQQGNQIYVGGDDDLQWIAALVNCYDATKDSTYLNAAQGAFSGLVKLGFWNPKYDPKKPSGWAWTSNDPRPMGVSTSYGALAAARLYRATGNATYREWALAALTALQKPQVSFIPRDEMIAVEASCIMYEFTKEQKYLEFAKALTDDAVRTIETIIEGKAEGERNPTDVGDLAEGLLKYADVSGKNIYAEKANHLVNFFLTGRTDDDIKASGFFSRYDAKGKQVKEGNYLGVPLAANYLPEVAEMLKLFAIEFLR